MLDFKSLIPTFAHREKGLFELLEIPLSSKWVKLGVLESGLVIILSMSDFNGTSGLWNASKSFNFYLHIFLGA
ncbi:hypothetical protein [Methyloglobulus sp.]|uniref:hypothetical protein n=1 Tax=Methyloglobulus sp. TaxID=2518622 RepID=UPI0032B753C6